ncbi:hypothetical protein MVEG_06923 [Podila verticillata NRRL 6337]|nr:hypothetical protein MVEG_06923 [Podila verticillata NRRL 6337]
MTAQLEWSINNSFFQHLDSTWGPHSVDLFAMAENAKVPRYVSWLHEETAWKQDAFSCSWKDLGRAYICPPWSLLNRVLEKIRIDRVQATVITPQWPAMIWYPTIRAMSTNEPIPQRSSDRPTTNLALTKTPAFYLFRSPDPVSILSDSSDSSEQSGPSSPLTNPENPSPIMATPLIPETFLKGLRPDTFNGRYRDTRAEDWLVRFERYCNAAHIPETGQDRILCAGLLLTDGASCWYDQLGTIAATTVNGQDLSAYQVFKYKFRQCFVNANDAEDAFDLI